MSLTNAKVGDVLLVGQQHGSRLETVDRTTKTLVYCGTTKFNRRGDRSPRTRWDYTHARIATVEDIAEVEEETRRRQCIHAILAKCENVNILRKMATAKLVRLVAVLEEKEID
jgi:hypothetical protein